jgi:hypothetical protein
VEGGYFWQKRPGEVGVAIQGSLGVKSVYFIKGRYSADGKVLMHWTVFWEGAMSADMQAHIDGE